MTQTPVVDDSELRARFRGGLLRPGEAGYDEARRIWNVGAAAAAVLTTEGHAGRTYRLTGPQALGYADVARELTAATGAPVEYADVPEAAAREAFAAAGMPAWLVVHLVGAFRLLRSGAFAETTDTVRALTGRGARSFAEFARDHRELFAAGPRVAGTMAPAARG